ncbi:DUF4279 domain-containing protein [Candidatus Soleaferrea massiliensis]|uniref:DUF4279 domain-containing protein n=1 Tax=Candidatus Soleaferrea massiliensis TaxID=1470354 RepID=UPI00058C1B63|nr:DUF4279 domain-containing protein [Candidatus Soleaferrea massiliensis]
MDESMNVMISFWVTGDEFDFDTVTQAVGVEPTQTCSKEECRNPMFACTRWNYETGYIQTDTVSDEFEKMVDLLWDHASDIEQTLRDHALECGFSIVIQAEEGQSPAIEFSRRCIQFAAMIDAEISVDIY